MPTSFFSLRTLPVGWLLVLACLLGASVFFLAATGLAVAGLAGLFHGVSIAPKSASSAPLLLVLTAEDLPPASANATPVSLRLQALVSAPLPAATPAAEKREIDPPPAGPVPSPAASLTYRDLFQEVGRAYGIDWRLLAALAYRESRLNPAAVGRDGDMGLMQILPGTWAQFASSPDLDPYDPRQNLEVAATYLLYLEEFLHDTERNEVYWVLAAYNWGPDRVRQLLAAGGTWDEVPERQRRYVEEIMAAAFGVGISSLDRHD